MKIALLLSMARPAVAWVSECKTSSRLAKLTDVRINLRRVGLIFEGDLQRASDSGSLTVHRSPVVNTNRLALVCVSLLIGIGGCSLLVVLLGWVGRHRRRVICGLRSRLFTRVLAEVPPDEAADSFRKRTHGRRLMRRNAKVEG